MDDGHSDDTMRAREALRLLNSRPGWRVGQARFYKLLQSGDIPSTRVRVVRYRHYYLTAAGVIAWAERIEQSEG